MRTAVAVGVLMILPSRVGMAQSVETNVPYGSDPLQRLLVGHSSGATLVALIGADDVTSPSTG